MSAFKLFPFQQTAADQLAESAQEWLAAYATHGVLFQGRTAVPFLGQLRAITGAGKTPILAATCRELAPAVVLWTSMSSTVVEQTYRNLNGRYRSLLGSGRVHVVRERPGKSEWEELVKADEGLTVWVTTVASWNERESAAAGGSDTARLNMHRPQRDWGGKVSPWEQLRRGIARPIWVVYDESHNQTPTQLDQLVGLGPVGFLLASATPPDSELFQAFEKIADDDATMSPIAKRARVTVSTRDVVDAQLLKHTLEVEDFQTEPEPMLGALLKVHKKQVAAAAKESRSFNPKAIYVVERSNPSAKEPSEIPRPVAIWSFLCTHKVLPNEIAIYTDTRAMYLPDEAEKIVSVTSLEPRHRHIIFNRGLQEGWDDPEAYLCYFDDETKSYVRIQQIVGRVLRQPGACHAANQVLNTAFVFIRVRNDKYDTIIEQIKRELTLYEYLDDEGTVRAGIRIRTKRDPLPDIAVKRSLKSKLVLPNYVLGGADLSEVERHIASQGKRPWPDDDLLAPGVRRSLTISLRGNEDRKRFAAIASRVRSNNAVVLRRRLDSLNRWASIQVEPSWMSGPAFEQRSSPGSIAQAELTELARKVVERYEATVEFEPNPIERERQWTISAHAPPFGSLRRFRNAAHSSYSTADFNPPELEFAEALDTFHEGVWTRNPPHQPGYGIPLPIKVGTSNSFYPDFLWWVAGTCFAIDPTGRFILEEKVRGKLLTLPLPRIVLVTQGKIEGDWTRSSDKEGWTMVRPRAGVAPAPEYFEDPVALLTRLVSSVPKTRRRSEKKAVGPRKRPSKTKRGAKR